MKSLQRYYEAHQDFRFSNAELTHYGHCSDVCCLHAYVHTSHTPRNPRGGWLRALNLRFQGYHPTRGRTTPPIIPRQPTLHDLHRQKDIARQTSAANAERVLVRGPPLRARAHDTVGLGTKASRTAPATQYAPRQPGTGTAHRKSAMV